jgi:flagellar motor switch protein FliN
MNMEEDVEQELKSKIISANNEEKEKEYKKRLELVTAEIDKLVDDYENTLSMQVTCHAFLGEAMISISEFLKLDKGYIINLNKAAGEGADFYLNDRMIGKGEIMVYEKSLAVRLNEIFNHDSIIYHFYGSSN